MPCRLETRWVGRPRKCREAWKVLGGRGETAKCVHKDAPPLEMICMVDKEEEPAIKRARV